MIRRFSHQLPSLLLPWVLVILLLGCTPSPEDLSMAEQLQGSTWYSFDPQDTLTSSDSSVLRIYSVDHGKIDLPLSSPHGELLSELMSADTTRIRTFAFRYNHVLNYYEIDIPIATRIRRYAAKVDWEKDELTLFRPEAPEVYQLFWRLDHPES